MYFVKSAGFSDPVIPCSTWGVTSSISVFCFLPQSLAMAAKSLRSTSAYGCSSKSNSINDLSDGKLLEILCRLPCIYIFGCRCVRKKWSALISNPNFHCQYPSHQHSHFQKLEDQVQQGFIMNPYDALVIVPNVPALELGSFEKGLAEFSRLRFWVRRVEPNIEVFLNFVSGCFNGLILCGKSGYPLRKFYICNPLTKVVLNLTSAPPSCYVFRFFWGSFVIPVTK